MEVTAALAKARLYGILDLGYVDQSAAISTAGLMLEGGVQVLQLRAKGVEASQVAALARQISPFARVSGVPFIINDHPGLVQETGADGTHVGQDDLSVAEARNLAGPDKIVGKSTHSIAQAIAAQAEAPDYIGFGPLFATPTKPDYIPIGINEITEAHRLVNVPIFCIGGIKLENLPAVIAAGATRVVIVSGLLQTSDIPGYCRACLSALPPL